VTHVVTRMCIGCRHRAPDYQLLRFVAVGSSAPIEVVPDPGRRAPGRGAWLHPDLACVSLAVRRRAFGRALKLHNVVDNTAVERYVEVLARRDDALA
jgi:predicted RNA-binding protein YlxR (DUF448 family)